MHEPETYTVDFEPRPSVIIRDLAHALETPVDERVLPALNALQHRASIP